MTVEKTQESTEIPDATIAEVRAENQEEIQKIMSEIEELQRELDATTSPAEAQTNLKLVPGGDLSSVDASNSSLDSEGTVPDETTSHDTIPGNDEGAGLSSKGDFSTGTEFGTETESGADFETELGTDAVSEGSLEETFSQIAPEPSASEESIFSDGRSERGFSSKQGFPASFDRVSPTQETQRVSPTKEPRKTSMATEKMGTIGMIVSSEDGSVSMALGGKIRLNVKYESSGKDFTIRFAEEAVHVVLSDGTEFQILIPIKGSKSGSNEAA
jgi:hypothetical protein